MRCTFTLRDLLILFVSLGAVLAILLPLIRGTRDSLRSQACVRNLHQLSLGLASYQGYFHRYPPVFVQDDAGRAVHSWRGIILPYLDLENGVPYQLGEAWDGPVNRRWHDVAPPVFRCPSTRLPRSHASYLACLSGDSDAALPGEELPLVSDLTSGPAVIDTAGIGAMWLEPRDVMLCKNPANLRCVVIEQPHAYGISQLDSRGFVGTFAGPLTVRLHQHGLRSDTAE